MIEQILKNDIEIYRFKEFLRNTLMFGFLLLSSLGVFNIFKVSVYLFLLYPAGGALIYIRFHQLRYYFNEPYQLFFLGNSPLKEAKISLNLQKDLAISIFINFASVMLILGLWFFSKLSNQIIYLTIATVQIFYAITGLYYVVKLSLQTKNKKTVRNLILGILILDLIIIQIVIFQYSLFIIEIFVLPLWPISPIAYFKDARYEDFFNS